MFDHLLERLAASRNPRFRFFVDAKRAYEDFMQEISVHFYELKEEHYHRAREDPRIREAERGFGLAIEMSEAEGALRDEAVARYQLGLVRHVCGEFEEATDLMRVALAVLGSLPRRDRGANMGACYYQLGVLALKTGNLRDAVKNLKCALQLSEVAIDLSTIQSSRSALDACAAAGADMNVGASQPIFDSGAGPSESNVLKATSEEERDSESGARGYRVPYSRRELIWLASYSVEANNVLMAELESMGTMLGRPINISRVAFGGSVSTQRHLRQPESDQHLCATMLVLEKATLFDERFQQFVDFCIQRVVAVPDFRLFVYLYDISVNELRDISDRELLYAKLFDTTQIDDAPPLEEFRQTLVSYIHRVEHIGAAAWWRKVRLRLAVMFGALATFILATTVILVLLAFPARLLEGDWSWLGEHGPKLASLALGILAFPLQAPLIFILLRGFRAAMIAPRDNVLLKRWVAIGCLVMLGATHFQNALRGPHSWIILGLAVGVVLDAIRRSGKQAERGLIDIEVLMKSAADPRWNEPSMTVLRGDPLKIFSCPLLPRSLARVFISYTPNSAKSSELAASLYLGLKKAGAKPFLDRASIPAGVSWRRTLNYHVSECDVLLSIMDEESVQREWVAAELLAAMEANQLTGAPKIIILVDPAVQEVSGSMLPIFRAVMSTSASPQIPGRPEILQLNRETRRSLVWALAPGRFTTTSVFTPLAAAPFVAALSIFGVVGGMGIFIGLGFGFLALLEMMADFPFATRLAGLGWVEPIALFLAFLLGFTARATVAWGYERDHRREMGVMMPTISTLGLAYALLLVLPEISILTIGWSIVLVVAGWMMVAWVMGAGVKERRVRS